MKKVLGILAAILAICIILVYWSLNSKPETIQNSILVNLDTIDGIDFRKHDSVVIEATNQYKSTELKNLMQGEHYRNAWSAPIKIPVVFLDTLFGGSKIVKEGGGKQTHSLKLENPNGMLYTLRSINKNPDALVPDYAKKLGLENIVIDGISAQHPYGATVAASLSQAVGILHTFPKIVFLPKQPTLGDYNEHYGNRLYMLEHETESDINWTSHSNVVKILNTDDLQELKQTQGNRLHIDSHALVRARLFDLVIGDWDRHAKQWGWVLQEDQSGLNAIPLPVDRDNAFFNLSGIIPSLIANKNVTPEMRPFLNEIDYLPGLIQPFDVYFLSTIPESVFMEEAAFLQEALTDEAIEKALRTWPSTIYDLDAKTISEKIKSRRNDLLKYAKGFKNVLDKKPMLEQPLKGSEDLKLSPELMHCFECNM